MDAFHLVIQVDTNVVLSFLAFNKQQRQNDTYIDLCQMESTLYCFCIKDKFLYNSLYIYKYRVVQSY